MNYRKPIGCHIFRLSISIFFSFQINFYTSAQTETIPNWINAKHSPFNLVEHPEITNPVLTANDVTDVSAGFVADPFIFHEDNAWYMFFEVKTVTDKKDIGLATSSDGLHWEYQKIVLSETKPLSYPLVLKSNGDYYMIPEANNWLEVRIYRANNFPYDWTYLTSIAHGRPFSDPSIFHYNNKWWMFVSKPGHDTLYLYYSNDLLSGWTEHPMSPVIEGDASLARPGGRSFVFDTDRIIRIAQKCDISYGEQVRAFEVDILTEEDYAEEEIFESPLLKKSGVGWNAWAMHNFDPWWTGKEWICAVDGRGKSGWSIGIYTAMPVSDFTAEPTSGIVPLTTTFTDESTGKIESWEWHFGDNSEPSNDQNPQHTYQDPGIYTVSLTVTGPAGSDTETKVDYIIASYLAQEIITTWSSGIWYLNAATDQWTQMYSVMPSGAIAAGDFTGDDKADVASIWSSGLWFQNGDTLGWTQVYHIAPDRLAAGDITGDGVDEIIGCGRAWGKGVWYRDVANGIWYHPWSGPPAEAMSGDHPINDTPDGSIAAGDVTGDGKADMISCWNSGLWYQDGATLSWTKVWKTAPIKVTCGDVTGDGQAEIIGPWSNGIWYRDLAKSKWTKMYSGVPSGDIAAGDYTGDGKADVASCWKSGLWYQNGDSLGWTKVTSTAPYTVAAGDITGVSINLKEGLTAYYPFNGNANDESGNGNHGIVYNVTLAEDRFRSPNSAYRFNITDDHIK